MRRGRRSGGTPLSFFSFQGVITGLTGILIAVALLLALDALRANASAASPAPPEPGVEPGPPIERLRADLDAENERLRAARARRDTLRAELDRNPRISLPRLRLETDQTKREIAPLEEELERLRQEARKEAARLQAAEKRSKDADANRKRAEAEEARLEEQIRKAKAGRAIAFIPERGDGKRVVLVECARDRIVIHGTGAPRPHVVQDPEALTIEPIVRAFARWLEGRDPEKERLVYLLRPEAVPWFADLVRLHRREGGPARDWDFGYEPLEPEAEVLEGGE